jgi:hypothetical protein
LTTQAYPLDGVNDALEAVKARPGGLVNIVVNPDRWHTVMPGHDDRKSSA